MSAIRSACALLLATPAVSQALPNPDASCKPLRTMAPFNVSTFASGGLDGKWYVQAQQPIIYLPKNEIYCVTATYRQSSATSVDVDNYANSNRVNGKVSDSGGTLQAVIKDPSQPSKLEVGPKFLPHILYGPYWVVAAGSVGEDGTTLVEGANAAGEYTWAVISGGQPTKVSTGSNICGKDMYKLFGKCLPKVGAVGELCANGEGVNDSGLWIFSGTPQMVTKELEYLVRTYVVGNGLDPSVLLQVNQTGCTYSPK